MYVRPTLTCVYINIYYCKKKKCERKKTLAGSATDTDTDTQMCKAKAKANLTKIALGPKPKPKQRSQQRENSVKRGREPKAETEAEKQQNILSVSSVCVCVSHSVCVCAPWPTYFLLSVLCELYGPPYHPFLPLSLLPLRHNQKGFKIVHMRCCLPYFLLLLLISIPSLHVYIQIYKCTNRNVCTFNLQLSKAATPLHTYKHTQQELSNQ